MVRRAFWYSLRKLPPTGSNIKNGVLTAYPFCRRKWQYAVDPDKGKQFKTIKELMHRADVSEVVNACDAGREGELIFRFVYEVAGCKKPMRRLWISSMEDGAIKAGFASLERRAGLWRALCVRPLPRKG